jgi:hypothetical protein
MEAADKTVNTFGQRNAGEQGRCDRRRVKALIVVYVIGGREQRVRVGENQRLRLP